jgi:hypothetical protein
MEVQLNNVMSFVDRLCDYHYNELMQFAELR